MKREQVFDNNVEPAWYEPPINARARVGKERQHAWRQQAGQRKGKPPGQGAIKTRRLGLSIRCLARTESLGGRPPPSRKDEHRDNENTGHAGGADEIEAGESRVTAEG